MEPAHILATINYFLPVESGGLGNAYEVGTVGSVRRNRDDRIMQITNMRGHESEFHLDVHGFAFHRHESLVTNYARDYAEVQKHYYPEMREFMLEVFKPMGATRVHIMGHTTRVHSYQEVLNIPENVADSDPIDIPYPAMLAHIDQSYDGAQVSLDNMGWSQPDPTKHRWAIVNAWRPLKPVAREPLAVCDARTVAETDLEEVTVSIREELLPPGKQLKLNKTWELRANPAHKWHWANEMVVNEVMFFKGFDSMEDGRARWAPHSAIQTPMDTGPARESIEVRALVFW